MHHRFTLIAATAILFAGCGQATTNPSSSSSGTSTSPSTSASTSSSSAGSVSSPLAGTATVVMKDFAFQPKTLVVKKGTVLTVTNQDSVGHSLTADDGRFDTGILSLNKSATITLDKPGTFKIHCLPHPTTLTGTITVVE